MARDPLCIKRKVWKKDRLSGSITYNELERWQQSEQSRRCNGSQGEDISAFSFLHNGLYVYCARLDNGCSWTVAWLRFWSIIKLGWFLSQNDHVWRKFWTFLKLRIPKVTKISHIQIFNAISISRYLSALGFWNIEFEKSSLMNWNFCLVWTRFLLPV